MAETAQLRQEIDRDHFDYQQLTACLSHLSKPRDKINKLLSKGEIVRIRKGLYTFGRPYRRGPLSRELLANLVYGPSYVSLDYALSYHGLIPERVSTVTSVALGRSRKFDTPLGTFTYWLRARAAPAQGPA
jgi:predicted transcriptional regulator of viral defense system